ncbi:hypothetical protein [Alicyclobacillus macrosporangiidus]|uniref:hypothetical protein n=1 Tax=Alicyclobacillus macrosporangiidus TaxID=392015 RepID=UPI001E3B77E4|nr:hypothetical protein [Alicyclobacillus macrosporangiidus]
MLTTTNVYPNGLWRWARASCISAFQVRGPTTPSVSRPFASWNVITAPCTRVLNDDSAQSAVSA